MLSCAYNEWVKNGGPKSVEVIDALPREHVCKCHQNSKHSPAVAEEFDVNMLDISFFFVAIPMVFCPPMRLFF
jgi:hypothetical protein